MTTEEFIERAKVVHGDRYIYDLVDYKRGRGKVKIICKDHGEFEQEACSHLCGKGCMRCSGKMQRTNEEFIEKCIEVHGCRYDYSKVDYINSKTKVKITCKIHGDFEQDPTQHLLRGDGCVRCNKNIPTTAEFIERANKIHNGKYDYGNVEYVKSSEKIKITCRKHGDFLQNPSNHLMGQGCLKCIKTSNSEDFIVNAIKVHGNRYNYNNVEYIDSNRHKVKITCSKHGEFEQIPTYHLSGCGCPKCNKSKGELAVEDLLEKNNIEFEIEKTFEDCKHKKLLPFDFYLPDHNILIEYDGIQHFKIVKRWGKEKFKITQRNDAIKTQYCTDNNIKLIRIPYFEFDNIEEILKSELGLE